MTMVVVVVTTTYNHYRLCSGRGDYGGRGGYDDWGKRPGDDLDGPPSRMRKMDNRWLKVFFLTPMVLT